MPTTDLHGPNDLLDQGVFPNRIGNQIAAAADPSVGGQMALVHGDGADEGWQGDFPVKDDYDEATNPKIRIDVILDGAPGAGDTLGWGFRKRAVADNEPSDGTFDTEQAVSDIIGSSGSGHGDEDRLVQEISLTFGHYAKGDRVHFHLYLDGSGTTYAGDVLQVSAEFDYTAG